MQKEYGHPEGNIDETFKEPGEIPAECPRCNTPLGAGTKCPNCEYEVPTEPLE